MVAGELNWGHHASAASTWPHQTITPFSSFLKKKKKIIYFQFVSILSACMHVHQSHACLVSAGIRRMHQVPWNWSFRWLRATCRCWKTTGWLTAPPTHFPSFFVISSHDFAVACWFSCPQPPFMKPYFWPIWMWSSSHGVNSIFPCGPQTVESPV